MEKQRPGRKKKRCDAPNSDGVLMLATYLASNMTDEEDLRSKRKDSLLWKANEVFGWEATVPNTAVLYNRYHSNQDHLRDITRFYWRQKTTTDDGNRPCTDDGKSVSPSGSDGMHLIPIGDRKNPAVDREHPFARTHYENSHQNVSRRVTDVPPNSTQDTSRSGLISFGSEVDLSFVIAALQSLLSVQLCKDVIMNHENRNCHEQCALCFLHGILRNPKRSMKDGEELMLLTEEQLRQLIPSENSEETALTPFSVYQNLAMLITEAATKQFASTATPSTAIIPLFATLLHCIVKCDICGTISDEEDKFVSRIDIFLSKKDLQDSIWSYFHDVIEEKIYCTRCEIRTRMRISKFMKAPPEVLCVLCNSSDHNCEIYNPQAISNAVIDVSCHSYPSIELQGPTLYDFSACVLELRDDNGSTRRYTAVTKCTNDTDRSYSENEVNFAASGTTKYAHYLVYALRKSMGQPGSCVLSPPCHPGLLHHTSPIETYSTPLMHALAVQDITGIDSPTGQLERVLFTLPYSNQNPKTVAKCIELLKLLFMAKDLGFSLPQRSRIEVCNLTTYMTPSSVHFRQELKAMCSYVLGLMCSCSSSAQQWQIMYGSKDIQDRLQLLEEEVPPIITKAVSLRTPFLWNEVETEEACKLSLQRWVDLSCKEFQPYSVIPRGHAREEEYQIDLCRDFSKISRVCRNSGLYITTVINKDGAGPHALLPRYQFYLSQFKTCGGWECKRAADLIGLVKRDAHDGSQCADFRCVLRPPICEVEIAGLHNLGVTCFINACTQVLLRTNFLYNVCLLHKPKFGCLCSICNVKEVIVAMNRKKSSVIPSTIVTFCRDKLYLQTNIQQDAHEYFIKMVNQIEEELNIGEFGIGGLMKCTCYCEVDGESTSEEQRFFYLTANCTNASLESNVEARMSQTRMSYGNTWNCPKCKEDGRDQTPTAAKVTVTKAPEILLIQIERYRDDGLNRDDTEVRMQKKFDLGRCMENNLEGTKWQYDLRGMILHEGNMVFGHYTAIARTSNIQYVRFDDDKDPANYSFKEGQLSKEPYLFLYERPRSSTFEREIFAATLEGYRSVLQVLRFSKNVRCIASLHQQEASCIPVCAACALHRFFQRNDADIQSTSVSNEDIIKVVHHLLPFHSSCNFNPYEFLQEICNTLESYERPANESGQAVQVLQKSMSLFRGSYKFKGTCLSCGEKKEEERWFNVLKVPLNSTLELSLRQFCENEKDDFGHCDSCTTRSIGDTNISFRDAPDVLCILVQSSDDVWDNGMMVPKCISVLNVCYELFGCVTHDRKSSTSTEYNSFVTVVDVYYSFKGTKVEVMKIDPMENVPINCSPYILFFHRSLTMSNLKITSDATTGATTPLSDENRNPSATNSPSATIEYIINDESQETSHEGSVENVEKVDVDADIVTTFIDFEPDFNSTEVQEDDDEEGLYVRAVNKCHIFEGAFVIHKNDWSLCFRDKKLHKEFYKVVIIENFKAHIKSNCTLVLKNLGSVKPLVRSPDTSRIHTYGKCSNSDACKKFHIEVTVNNEEAVVSVYSDKSKTYHTGVMTYQLRGLRRDIAKAEIAKGRLKNYQKETILQSEVKQVLSGSIEKVQSDSVLRQMRAENSKDTDLQTDILADIDCRRVEESKGPAEEIYIRQSGGPLHTFLWSVTQLSTYTSRIRKREERVVYLDATGKVVGHVLGDSSKVYLYSGAVQVWNEIFTLFDWIETRHNEGCISNPLQMYRSFCTQTVGSNCWPLFAAVITDWSFAIINAVMNAWNNTTLMKYLQKTFLYLSEGKGTDMKCITPLYLCKPHWMKLLANRIHELLGKKSGKKTFLMEGMCFLCLSTSLVEFIKKLKSFFTVLMCETEGEAFTSAFKEIMNVMDKVPEDDKTERAEITNLADELEEHTWEPQANLQHTLFHELCYRVYLETADKVKCLEPPKDATVNKFHCPLFIKNIFLPRFAPTIPLWTEVLKNALGQNFSSCNSVVENNFNLVKNLVLEGTKNERVGRFVVKWKRHNFAICKKLNLGLRTTTNQKAVNARKQLQKKINSLLRAGKVVLSRDDVCGKGEEDETSIIGSDSEEDMDLEDHKSDIDIVGEQEERWESRKEKHSYLKLSYLQHTAKKVQTRHEKSKASQKTVSIRPKEVADDTASPTVTLSEGGLSQEYEAYVGKLSQQHDLHIVATYPPFDRGIYVVDILSLLGNNKLGSGIIDLCLYLMLNLHALQTTFQVMDTSEVTYILEGDTNVLNHIELWGETILAPVKFNMNWMLCVIRPKEGSMCVFNGLKEEEILKKFNDFIAAHRSLCNVARLSLKSEPHFSAGREDEFGVHLLIHAERIMKNSTLTDTFCVENERTRYLKMSIDFVKRNKEDEEHYANGLYKNVFYYNFASKKSYEKFQEKKLQYVVSTVGYGYQAVQIEDMYRLLSNEWLSGTAIDAILHAYQQKYSNEKITIVRYDQASIAMSLRFSENFDLVAADFGQNTVILPLNVKKQHWVLLVLDFERKTVMKIDPGSITIDRNILEKVKKFLKKRQEMRHEPSGVEEWTQKIPQGYAKQKKQDRTNCGIYCLYYAISILTGSTYTEEIDPEEKRIQYAAAILEFAPMARSLCVYCGKDEYKFSGNATKSMMTNCSICYRWAHFNPCMRYLNVGQRQVHNTSYVFTCLLCVENGETLRHD